MGRRVKKSVSTFSSGSWLLTSESLFLYDGWNLIKKTTTPAGGTSVDKYFVWGLDLSQSLQGAGGVGGLLASVQGSLTYNYFFDANGNVGQVVEAGNGSVAAHYEYDPYGNELRAVGLLAGENEYRFSTRYYDSEVKLYYYGYRYYSPELGRWINRDPIREFGGLNLYLFNRNNSINLFDLYGLKEINGLEIIKEFCQCEEKIKEEIEWMEKVKNSYKTCYESKVADGKPKCKKGNELNDCVINKLSTEENAKPEIGATTDSEGNITYLKKSSGPCGAIGDKMMDLHENVHKRDTLALLKEKGVYLEKEKSYGHTFDSLVVWQSAKYTIETENRAYDASLNFLKAVLKELRVICCEDKKEMDEFIP